jgi:site-specific recombinase XerC
MGYVDRAVRMVRVLTAKHRDALLRVSGEHVDGFRDHVIFSVALGTALREGEIAALDVGDVVEGSARGKKVTIRGRVTLRAYARKGRQRPDGKPHTPQVVYVSRAARAKLERFIGWKKTRGEDLGPEAPLFCGYPGQRIAVRTMRQRFGVWQERAGISPRYTFHHLRHTGLSALYRATKDIMLVRAQARHSRVTTTQIYAHANDDDLRKAVEELPA